MLLCLAWAVFLTACDRAVERGDNDRIVLRYWEKWTGFEAEAMQAVVDDFNHAQDRIYVKMVAVSQIEQKTMLATSGGNPPDVAGLIASSISAYAEKGALLPLDGRLKEAGVVREDYFPALWEICTHRGFVWALPSTPASNALHWNRRLFQQAGLDPDVPPQSLAELDQMAERLTVVEVIREGTAVRLPFSELTSRELASRSFVIVQLGFSPTEPGWWRQSWGHWFGGRLWDGGRTITADSAENIAAFQWVAGYAEKYGARNMLDFGSTFGNFASAQNPFLNGRVAMVIQGVWMHNFIQQFAPTLDWAAAPFPSVDPDRWPGVCNIDCDVLVIPRGARHPEASFEFIRYVNRQGPMEKLCLGQRKFSALRSMSEDFVQDHPNPWIDVFIALAGSPNAMPAPRVAVWHDYREELLVAVDRIFRGDVPAAVALGAARRRAQWKLDRALRRWERTGGNRTEEWKRWAEP